MNTEKNTAKAQASRKVLKKLSAVRAVLPKDQRDALDAIVLGEVQAHALTKSASKGASKAGAKRQVRAQVLTRSISKGASKAGAKRQVNAHVLTRSISKGASKAGAKRQVNAHMMPPETPIQESTIPQIEFDPNREEYHSIPE